MNVDRTDLIQYVYILGILMTGVYLERMVAPFGNLTVVATVLVAGILWLQYYKLSIVPRIEHATASDEE